MKKAAIAAIHTGFNLMFAIICFTESVVMFAGRNTSGQVFELFVSLFPSGEIVSSAVMLLLCGILNAFSAAIIIFEWKSRKYFIITISIMTLLTAVYFLSFLKYTYFMIFLLLLALLQLLITMIYIVKK